MWVSIVAWVVTVASSLWAFSITSSFSRCDFDLGVGEGRLTVTLIAYAADGAGQKLQANWEIEFRPGLSNRRMLYPGASHWQMPTGPDVTDVWSPMWCFAILPTVAFLILHRRNRRLVHRLTHNLCSRCGYSRAGIAEGAKCPECGS